MKIYHAALGEPLPRLSPEDNAKPYAEYYYCGPVRPESPMYEKTLPGNPMEPKYALLPEQIGTLFKGEEVPEDRGYCITSDGFGYASITTNMPNVTMPMVRWYGKWNLEDPLRYTIWFPGSHVTQDQDWIVEDLGFGMCELFIKMPLSAASFHISPDIAAENGCLLAGGSNALMKVCNGPEIDPPYNIALLHYVRAAERGIQWHTRFWIGIEVVDGKAVNRLRPGQTVPLEIARGFCEHSAYEMATRAARLPEWYQRFGNE